jgi:Zn-dependent protease with chaperone function
MSSSAEDGHTRGHVERQREADPGHVDARVVSAGTTLRFVLLLLLIAASCVSFLHDLTPYDDGLSGKREVLCIAAGGIENLSGVLTAVPPDRTMRAIDACVAGIHDAALRWTLGTTATVLLIAFVTYWAIPHWRRRRRRLVPLAEYAASEGVADGAGLHTELQELVTAADLSAPPEFVVDTVSTAVDAVVFGRMGRYTVCLHGGLLVQRATAPDGFRAVVLHELAHIRNRDVDLTYAGVALWRVFLAAVLLPYAVVSLLPAPAPADVSVWRQPWQGTVHDLVRAVALTVLVYLARADVLRTRETYADLDALRSIARLPGFGGRPGDGRVGDRDGRDAGPTWWSGPLDAFLRLWRTHPRWDERLRMAEDPSGLFAVTPLPMFLAGVAAVLVADQLGVLGSGALTRSMRIVPWLAAVLVAGIAANAVWRAVAYAAVTGRDTPSGLGAGTALGAGLTIGQLVTFQDTNVLLFPRQPAGLLLIAPVMSALLWWTAECADLWVRSSRGRSVMPGHLAGLTATACVFSAWFTKWDTVVGPQVTGFVDWPVRQLAASFTGVDAAAWNDRAPGWLVRWLVVSEHLASHRLVYFSACVLWVFPLLAWVRRPPSGVPVWMLRVVGPRDVTARTRDWTLPSLRPVAGAAVMGGLLCGTGAVLGAHLMKPSDAEQPAILPVWQWLAAVWMEVLLCAGVVVTGAVTCLVVRRQRFVRSLIAAAGAGLVGLTCVFALLNADGCGVSLGVTAQSCRWHPDTAWWFMPPLVAATLGLGVLLAALAITLVHAAVVALGAARVRRGRTPVQVRAARQPTSSPRVFRRRAGVVVTCTALATLSASFNTLRSEDVVAVPRPTREESDLRISAWLLVGGLDRLQLLLSGHVDYAEAATNFGRLTSRKHLGELRTACSRMRHHAEATQRFLPIPEPRLQQDWEAALSGTSRAADNCLGSLARWDLDRYNTAVVDVNAARSRARAVRVALLEHSRTSEYGARGGAPPRMPGQPYRVPLAGPLSGGTTLHPCTVLTDQAAGVIGLDPGAETADEHTRKCQWLAEGALVTFEPYAWGDGTRDAERDREGETIRVAGRRAVQVPASRACSTLVSVPRDQSFMVRVTPTGSGTTRQSCEAGAALALVILHSLPTDHR